eukprot:scaffold12694_cov46-Attheya_sp.AAC.1
MLISRKSGNAYSPAPFDNDHQIEIRAENKGTWMDYACWQGKGLHNADSIYPSCLDARLPLDHCERTVYSIEPCPNA